MKIEERPTGTEAPANGGRTPEKRLRPLIPGLGLIKGLLVTLRTMLKRSVTQQYPREKPDLPPRTRGVIALKQENCTVCYKCSRACPDWCIYIDAHKETHEPATGGRGRSYKVLDRFDIDFALCMYCGICIEVCPFDALFWTPEFEYAEYDIRNLLHDRDRLQDWTYTVLPPPPIELGADPPLPEPAPEATGPPAGAQAAPAGQPRGASILPETAGGPATRAAPPEAEGGTGGGEGGAKQAPPADAPPAGGPAPAAESPAAEAPAAEAPAAEAPAAEAPAAEAPAAEAPAAESPAAEAPAAEAAPTPAAAPAPAAPHAEVEPDQETYDRVLREEQDKGTDKRVAEGRAKAAAIRAARKKAQGG